MEKVNTQYKTNLIDYIFWVIVILFLDPGGYVQELTSLRNFKTISIPVLWLLFLLASNFQGFHLLWKDRILRVIVTTLALWYFCYYLGVFIFLLDKNSELSFLSKLVKTRISLISWTLILPVYYFTCYRNIKVFLKIFILSTITLGTALVLYYALGLNVVNVVSASRGFVETDRYILKGFGLVELGLYIIVAVSILPKKYFAAKRINLILASVAAYLIYLFSLTRRYFFFVLVAWVIGHFISKYVFQKGIIRARVLVAALAILVVSAFTLNEYLVGAVRSFETLSFDQKRSFGTTAIRLSLFQYEPIINKIDESPFFGSGYINGWYSNDKDLLDSKDMLKGADFVFLASIGMFGFVGILLFVPFYFFMVKMVFSNFRFIKNHKHIIIQNASAFWPPLIIFLSTSIFFIRHLFIYPNWFSFIGPNGVFEKYYIFTALLMGSGYRIYTLTKSLAPHSNSNAT